MLLAIARVFVVFARLVEDIYWSSFSFVLDFFLYPGEAMWAIRPQYLASFIRKVILVGEEVWNSVAGRQFSVNEATIPAWSRQKMSSSKLSEERLPSSQAGRFTEI